MMKKWLEMMFSLISNPPRFISNNLVKRMKTKISKQFNELTTNNMDKLLKEFDEKFGEYGTYAEKGIDALQTEVDFRLNAKKFLLHAYQVGVQDSLTVVEKEGEDRKYKAMVENGDLSFLNFTPTEIYRKALSDLKVSLQALIKKETQ
jgi:hypothetical protein